MLYLRCDLHYSRSFVVTSITDLTATLPCPQVHDFFSYIYRTAQLECDCVVTSLYYVERLLMETAGELRICRSNWRSLILSGMILASKVWDDLSMWSVDFARVSLQVFPVGQVVSPCSLQSCVTRTGDTHFERAHDYVDHARTTCGMTSACGASTLRG